MSGETYGLIIDTAGFVLTALVPWLARLVAGRRTMVHALLGGDGAGSPSGYACRILRRRVLSVGADDVKVHLSQPLREKVDYHDRGLNLVTSSESLQALLITARSQLQPKHDYYVPLAVGDGRTGLEPSDRQGGMTLVLKHEWTIRMRRVRWVAGVVTALLAVGALFAYLGWVVDIHPQLAGQLDRRRRRSGCRSSRVASLHDVGAGGRVVGPPARQFFNQISTRRLLKRPSSVAFVSEGQSSPNQPTSGTIPASCSTPCTACARFMEIVSLMLSSPLMSANPATSTWRPAIDDP